MKANLKRLYFFACCAVFIIMAPFLVYYAKGWRYDFGAKKFILTGSIMLASHPQKASVRIDGKTLAEKTPILVQNVLPGQHFVSIEKDNYYSWSKNFYVESARSIISKNIVLFYHAMDSETVFPDKIIFSSLSPSGKYLLFATRNGDILLHEKENLLKENKATKLGVVRPEFFTSARDSWDDSEKDILLYSTENAEVYTVDASEKKVFSLKVTDNLLKKVYFENSDHIVYLDAVDNTVRRLALSAGVSQIIEKDVLDFSLNNGIMYLCKENKNRSEFQLYRLNDDQAEIMALYPMAGNLGVLGFIRNHIVLSDTKSSLYITSLDNKPQTIAQIQGGFTWMRDFPNEKKFLFGNENEINVYDYSVFQYKLMIRSAEAIHDATWHPSGQAFVYSIGDRTETRELDDRDTINSFQLRTEQARSLSIDSNGKYIYYVAQKDSFLKRLQIGE